MLLLYIICVETMCSHSEISVTEIGRFIAPSSSKELETTSLALTRNLYIFSCELQPALLRDVQS